MVSMHQEARNTSKKKLHNLNVIEATRSDDIQNECWYPDSGAIHYLTSNPQNRNIGKTTN